MSGPARAPAARAESTPEKEEMKRKLTLALTLTATFALALAPAALAAGDINSVLSNLRVWLTGLLAALATLFLTIGGIRYLLAGGDPAALERAKGSIKAAIIGFALALLAPGLPTGVSAACRRRRAVGRFGSSSPTRIRPRRPGVGRRSRSASSRSMSHRRTG